MTSPDANLTIVLIHGLYLTPRSWEHWIERYERRGHRVLAPAWPGLEGEVEALRRDPSPIARQSVEAILDHHEAMIRGLPSPPILIGHSFGGAFVQVLLSRGLGAAGVAIHSAMVRGVPDLPWSTVKANLPLLLNPFNRNAAIALRADQFNYAFTNSFASEAARAAYNRYAIPGSRNVLLTGGFANLNPGTALRVDFASEDRVPLLFIAGGSDHLIPPSIVRHNAAKYAKSATTAELREFPGRCHFTMIQDGWEEVADYALSWALEKTSVSGVSAAGSAEDESVLVGTPARVGVRGGQRAGGARAASRVASRTSGA